MLTSSPGLTLEKGPGSPAQVCLANKTLARTCGALEPSRGASRLPSSCTSLEGWLSRLGCSLYAIQLRGRRPVWLQNKLNKH